jgi:hypothetical protein
LEILMPPADVDAIRKVAAWTGESTLTAVVRNALKAYVWMVAEQRRNCRILSEDRSSGARTELMHLLNVAMTI